MPNNLVLCQNSNDTILNPNPGGGIWSTLGVNTLLPSSCLNSIDNFPYVESFESSLADWSNDINNDFDWVIYSNATPSNNTGPSAAYDGNNYIYTESSNSNFPFKNSSITSPCINMSQYDNPILNFYYHKFGNGNDNAILSVDISTDNGLSWQLDIWNLIGNIDDQWHNQSLNLLMSCSDFSPTVTTSLSHLECDSVSDLIITVSQDAGETDMATALFVSDGGSFTISSLSIGDNIGSATLTNSILTYNTDLYVTSITGSTVTVSDSLANTFLIENLSAGVSITATSPGDNNSTTSGNTSSVTFNNIFHNI